MKNVQNPVAVIGIFAIMMYLLLLIAHIVLFEVIAVLLMSNAIIYVNVELMGSTVIMIVMS